MPSQSFDVKLSTLINVYLYEYVQLVIDFNKFQWHLKSVSHIADRLQYALRKNVSYIFGLFIF